MYQGESWKAGILFFILIYSLLSGAKGCGANHAVIGTNYPRAPTTYTGFSPTDAAALAAFAITPSAGETLAISGAFGFEHSSAASDIS